MLKWLEYAIIKEKSNKGSQINFLVWGHILVLFWNCDANIN